MWTLDDTQFLVDNYYTLGANKCSERLNRTKGSVRNKASRLGLKSGVTKATALAENYTKWLATNRPDIISLHPYKLSSTPILHKNLKCGHTWDAPPNRIKSGHGCPYCAKNRKDTTDSYKTKIAHTEFQILEEYIGTEIKVLHEHNKCGHIWKVRPHDILKGQNCPKCSRTNYSKIAIEWLDSFNNPNILHAENVGEQTISGFKVDGYDPLTSTIYEFHGDVYHGNLDIFDQDHACHPFDKNVTAGELWDNTFDKMQKLSKVGSVIYIWERDYKNGKASSKF